MKPWKRGDRQPHVPMRAWKRRPRIRPGTLPGTLLPPAEALPPARITLIRFSRETFEEAEGSIEEAVGAVSPGGVTWINVDGLDPAVLTRLELVES